MSDNDQKSIIETVYATAKDLHEAGVVDDAKLREFEDLLHKEKLELLRAEIQAGLDSSLPDNDGLLDIESIKQKAAEAKLFDLIRQENKEKKSIAAPGGHEWDSFFLSSKGVSDDFMEDRDDDEQQGRESF